jgi:hypothetical protein
MHLITTESPTNAEAFKRADRMLTDNAAIVISAVNNQTLRRWRTDLRPEVE